MHEHSLVQALLEQVDKIRCEHGADRIHTICVSVGQFSGIESELFLLAFETLSENTIAEGAELLIQHTTLQAKCDECDCEFTIERFHFECPACHSRELTIIRGEDLVLESVTMDQAESSHEQANG